MQEKKGIASFFSALFLFLLVIIRRERVDISPEFVPYRHIVQQGKSAGAGTHLQFLRPRFVRRVFGYQYTEPAVCTYGFFHCYYPAAEGARRSLWPSAENNGG